VQIFFAFFWLSTSLCSSRHRLRSLQTAAFATAMANPAEIQPLGATSRTSDRLQLLPAGNTQCGTTLLPVFAPNRGGGAYAPYQIEHIGDVFGAAAPANVINEYVEVGPRQNGAGCSANGSGWCDRGVQNAFVFRIRHHRRCCKRFVDVTIVRACCSNECVLKVARCQDHR